VILIDRHIADLCRGVVPDELRFYYSSLWADIPAKVLPMVEPFDPSLVNPASLDIRVGQTAKLRTDNGYLDIDLSNYSESKPFWFVNGDRLLVASLEKFCLPNFLCAQFKLKSSRGREWYGHQLAGFCDPGWSHSKLTMELTNDDLAPLPIYPGLKMGQLVFSLTLAPPDQDYSVRGRYNNDRRVMESKG
jgi:dCTP deaminase